MQQNVTVLCTNSVQIVHKSKMEVNMIHKQCDAMVQSALTGVSKFSKFIFDWGGFVTIKTQKCSKRV